VVAPYRVDLFTGCAAALETAWVSPSSARARFGEDLAGVGSAVASAFSGQGREFWAEADHEPVEVDPEDPRQGWKTDPADVASRAAWRAQNPYWGR
jgi:hypothetical protein